MEPRKTDAMGNPYRHVLTQGSTSDVKDMKLSDFTHIAQFSPMSCPPDNGRELLLPVIQTLVSFHLVVLPSLHLPTPLWIFQFDSRQQEEKAWSTMLRFDEPGLAVMHIGSIPLVRTSHTATLTARKLGDEDLVVQEEGKLA